MELVLELELELELYTVDIAATVHARIFRFTLVAGAHASSHQVVVREAADRARVRVDANPNA